LVESIREKINIFVARRIGAKFAFKSNLTGNFICEARIQV
jgi:hypothetical protein